MAEWRIDKYALMELDIDERITYIWAEIDKAAKEGRLNDITFIASLVRTAYGQGYTDALSEPRGRLHRDNGFIPPPPLDQKG